MSASYLARISLCNIVVLLPVLSRSARGASHDAAARPAGWILVSADATKLFAALRIHDDVNTYISYPGRVRPTARRVPRVYTRRDATRQLFSAIPVPGPPR
ncbi:hypothetical protein DFH08DRAFT_970737 [Mycena albidolilacea]|uniref:Secreted protein n=1 Tax=Mycena albidolilacea TaxID=1033008 RepID=A0AAD7EFD2_9AGAR|nr:hypothetical protein DFH08DRAFT_970737 [Mycena albidolilacea]